MMRMLRRFTILCLLCLDPAPTWGQLHRDGLGSPDARLTWEAAFSAGREGYIYGYPLVVMDVTHQRMTNVSEPRFNAAPVNQFLHVRRFPSPVIGTVSLNVDTLYSSGWLDLADEPIVMHVPAIPNRYYMIEIMDAWSNNFPSIGPRTTGAGEALFAFVGPQWSGILPEGVQAVEIPTDMTWLIGRIYCTGTFADYAEVNALQDQLTLTPLSALGGPYDPPPAPVDPSVDMETPPADQVAALDPTDFFNRLAQLMVANPPAGADALMVAGLGRLSIVAGQEFSLSALHPVIADAVEQGLLDARARIDASFESVLTHVNGWSYSLDVGEWGTDYLFRAVVARFGLGVNLPEDAAYYFTARDANGERLNGAHAYLLRFAPDQLPPVNAFWSVTLYDAEQHLVANVLGRYAIRSGDPLGVSEDGSTEILLQNGWPGVGQLSNWLPAPPGDFNLILRAYWPTQSLLDGAWVPPAVIRLENAGRVTCDATPTPESR